MSRKIWGVIALLLMGPLQAEEEGRSVALGMPLSGVVAQVLVEEGQQVTVGTVLLKLDPRRYQYQLQFAEAALKELQVEQEDLQIELEQQLELFERMVTTESDLKRAKRKAAVIEAKIAQKQALRDIAALDLERTTLKAPLDGIVSRRLAEPGMVVSQEGEPVTLLILKVK